MIRNEPMEKVRRLESKRIDEAFQRKVQEGLNCGPVISGAVLDMVKRVYFPLGADQNQMQPGRVCITAVSCEEPPGKPLSECAMVPVVLTLFADGDEKLRKEEGVIALRRVQIKRMSEEAVEQGAYLTLEDLAYRLLNCGMRTLNRDLKELRTLEIPVPLRGAMKDIGRSITHRKQIIEAHLRGQTYTQISRNFHHSESAIRSYIVTFTRVALLSRKGAAIEDIAYLVQISASLVREYQSLLQSYLSHPDYGTCVEEMMADLEARLQQPRPQKGGLK